MTQSDRKLLELALDALPYHVVMSDTQRAAAQQALEALEFYRSGEDYQPTPASKAIDALRAALAEPMTDVESRAAFEEFAQDSPTGRYSVDRDTRSGRVGQYWSSHTQIMWAAWQAAISHARAHGIHIYN